MLAGVSQAGCYAVDGEEDGVGEVGAFALLVGGGLLGSFVEDEGAAGGAETTEQGYLEVAQGVDVGVAQADGALEDWRGVEQGFAAHDL